MFYRKLNLFRFLLIGLLNLIIESQGCRNNPCKFGGTCVFSLTDGTETCRCKDGFTGNFCEIGNSNLFICLFKKW